VKDFAKFGELYRNQCKINGAWVIDSTYYFDAIHPADLTHPDGRKATLYGYQWWLMDHQGHHIFYARGLNGQYIFVIPDLEAVVVRLGHHRDVKKLDDHPIDVFGYLEQAYYLIDQAN
jgi:CubicO group peptidase (beta-lactamase class C family)